MSVNPIFAACNTYTTKDLEELIKSKADVNVSDANGDTPLMFAVRRHQSSTKMLIDAGADVNHRNKAGESVMDIAMSDDVRNHGAAVDLLEAGAVVGKDKNVFDSIRQCECTCNHPIVIRWCEENGLKHSKAAFCVDENVVEENRNMFYSCEEGYFDKYSMRGGCTYARDVHGQRMLMYNMDSWRSFCYAVSYDDFDVNCYPDCSGRTLLHHAVLGGSRKVLREVLKKRPDVTAVDNDGQTAMMMLQSERSRYRYQYNDDDDDDAVNGYVDEYDGDDESDPDCWTSWGKDPLNVEYGENDSLIEMLVKYMRAQEVSREAETDQ
jgi:hypothetical protein